jgi:predicted metallopeptidase
MGPTTVGPPYVKLLEKLNVKRVAVVYNGEVKSFTKAFAVINSLNKAGIRVVSKLKVLLLFILHNIFLRFD